MKKKIVLGTANLSDKYGLLKNFLDEKNFVKCLKQLNKKNFNYLETSLNYKNSDLGNYFSHFKLRVLPWLLKLREFPLLFQIQ